MWIGGTLLLIPLVIDLISLFQFVPKLERPPRVRNSTRRRPVARHQGNRPLYKQVPTEQHNGELKAGSIPSGASAKSSLLARANWMRSTNAVLRFRKRTRRRDVPCISKKRPPALATPKARDFGDPMLNAIS